MERQMAVVLVQERQESLVVRGVHVKKLDQFLVTSLGSLQTTLDELPEIGFRELAVQEHRIDDNPETSPTHDHLIPSRGDARQWIGDGERSRLRCWRLRG